MRSSKTVFVALVAVMCLSGNAVGQMSISGSGIVFLDGSTQSTALPAFVNVYRVPADGTPLENGVALRAVFATYNINRSLPTLIELDAGTYDVASSYFFASMHEGSLLIRGQGRNLTVITGNSDSSIMTLGSFDESESRVLGLMDLSVENYGTGDCIHVGQGKSLFERCRFILSGSGGQLGIGMADFSGNTDSWDVTMRDCTITNTTPQDSSITGVDFSDGRLTLDRCEISINNPSFTSNWGIRLAYDVDFFMSNSRISGVDRGMVLESSSDPIGISVIGCIFEGMSSFALDMNEKQNIRFMNSYIQGSRLNCQNAWFASCYSWSTLSPIADNTP